MIYTANSLVNPILYEFSSWIYREKFRDENDTLMMVYPIPRTKEFAEAYFERYKDSFSGVNAEKDEIILCIRCKWNYPLRELEANPENDIADFELNLHTGLMKNFGIKDEMPSKNTDELKNFVESLNYGKSKFPKPAIYAPRDLSDLDLRCLAMDGEEYSKISDDLRKEEEDFYQNNFDNISEEVRFYAGKYLTAADVEKKKQQIVYLIRKALGGIDRDLRPKLKAEEVEDRLSACLFLAACGTIETKTVDLLTMDDYITAYRKTKNKRVP